MRLHKSIVVICYFLSVMAAKAENAVIGSPLIGGQFPLGNNRSAAAFDPSDATFNGGSLRQDFAKAIQQAGQATAINKVFTLNVDAARKQFFDLYPDKPGVEAARIGLANLLVQIDLYYLSMYLPAGMTDYEMRRVSAIDQVTGGPFGHGIQPSAQGAFRRWVDTAREAMGAIPRDPSTGLVNAITGAPIANVTPPLGTISVEECTKPVVSCGRTSFVPTAEGYIEGIKASSDTYAYYVLFRDRAETSESKHVPISELPPITSAPPQPPTVLLVTQEIVPFSVEALGTNNFQAANTMGTLFPNGGNKWATYNQVVQTITQASKYKLLNCTYGDHKAVYHFWSGEVPPNFSQLVAAVVPSGGVMVGEAARLGTKPVSACPPDERKARELRRTLLSSLDLRTPSAEAERNIFPLSHEKVGAIAPGRGSFQGWENLIKPGKEQNFISEVDKDIALNQQVLECAYQVTSFKRTYYYWYKSPPQNVAALIGLLYYANGVISHMGTSGKESCPSTVADADKTDGQLIAEGSSYVRY